jgi:hypothetical protein
LFKIIEHCVLSIREKNKIVYLWRKLSSENCLSLTIIFAFLSLLHTKHTHKIVVECRVALFVVGGSKFTKLLEIGEDDVAMFMFGEKSIDF